MNIKSVFLAGAMIASASFASAATIIDDFSQDQGPATDVTVGGGAETDGPLAGIGTVWVDRTLSAELLSSLGGTAELSVEVTGGVLNADTTFGETGVAGVIYSFDGFNLNDSGDTLQLAFQDIGSDLEFDIAVEVESAGGFSSISDTMGPFPGGDGEIAFRFSDFTGDANFSSITGLSIFLGGATDSLDLQISAVASQVPLPAGAVLLMTALGGLGVARRRKKAA